MSDTPPASTCPVCGKDDRLLRVATILDSGTSTTHTSGSTSVNTYDGGGATGSYSSTSTSSTVLAARLSPPKRPKATGHFWLWSLLVWAVIEILILAIGLPLVSTANPADAAATGSAIGLVLALAFWGAVPFFLLAMLLALIPSGITKAARAMAVRARQSRWDAGVVKLRSAYYCERDAVAFDAQGHADASGFRDAIFAA